MSLNGKKEVEKERRATRTTEEMAMPEKDADINTKTHNPRSLPEGARIGGRGEGRSDDATLHEMEGAGCSSEVTVAGGCWERHLLFALREWFFLGGGCLHVRKEQGRK